MKDIMKFYTIMAMMGVFSTDIYSSDKKAISEMSGFEIEKLKKYIIAERKRRLLKKGVKEFHFDFGITILAINEKNAKRKYDKYKKLL